ncbi:unnamed protein product [Tilletia controversa]|uniref:DUF4187 domain-containing protein n=3 Tax=Tilletia TaxID=13289 RepID=A0A8X7STX4_9BASI|nr:hypothetical protein CF328_g6991 [Tilletia controversa]KAE8191456.1 hypothetical protein CF336_g4862 [Tilletia laevis]KAE8258973.1 hypothetical protein A4X03_0g4229 [Tilletia caries]KAE8198965.1 hypothetical protein CF335_g4276 [Tilletia laevis]KAE8240875.1 hypothetical protein A4X06_0g7764 [Tilletia controversa]
MKAKDTITDPRPEQVQDLAVERQEAAEEDEEEDFMSDALLAKMLAATAGLDKNHSRETYTEKRRRQQNERDRNAAATKRKQSQVEREREARREAMGKNLIEREMANTRRIGADSTPDRSPVASRLHGPDTELDSEDEGGVRAKPRPRTDQQAGSTSNAGPSSSGPSAALKMMLLMGYQHGNALGVDPSDGPSTTSLTDPTAGLSSLSPSSSAGVKEDRTQPLAVDDRWSKARYGLGNAAVLRTKVDDCPRADPDTSVNASAASQGQSSSLTDFRSRRAKEEETRRAEMLLRNARRTCEDLDRKMGLDFSVLWLDPNLLRPDARPTEEDVELLDRAFPPVHTENEHESSRRRESERFCMLDAQSRLALTTAHLRRVCFYCLFCGCSYSSAEELQAQCPGEDEDDH